MASVKIDSDLQEGDSLVVMASQSAGPTAPILSAPSVSPVASAGAAEITVNKESATDSQDCESERRRAGRREVTVRIDYATVDEMFSEFTRDINAGGLFIETDKPHPSGTEVSMQFHLPGSPDVLRTVGRVVRVAAPSKGVPGGMGIEFDELTADDRSKIDRIVRALRSEGKL